MMNKTIAELISKFIATSLFSLLVFSCTTPVNNTNNQLLQANENKRQNGTNLSININFKGFATKASANGLPAKTINDIQAAKLYLTASNGSNPLLSANLKFASGIIVYPAGSTSKTYTFYNVPPGTYYAAAELFDNLTATNNIIEPQIFDSATAGDTSFSMAGGMRGLTLSANSAIVTAPAMTYTFSDNSAAFNISPKLLNAGGASINTALNLQPGSNTPANPITLQ